MGAFRLGALIGTNQSFDVGSGNAIPNSWATFTPCSFYPFPSPTDTIACHSSTIGTHIAVQSGGTDHMLRYQYGNLLTVFPTLFPDVVSHTCYASVWGMNRNGVSASQMLFRLQDLSGGNPATLDTYLSTATNVFSRYNFGPYTALNSNDLTFGIIKANVFVGGEIVNLDDTLMRVDEIVLYPEWSYVERAQLMKSQYRSLGGGLHTYTWGKHFAYDVPVRFLSDSYAALLNWWWENQFNLALTLDTSDAESTYIVRIVNDQQPIGSRIQPDMHSWEGVLQLESINRGALVF